jgi:hypothetical protein
MKWISRKDEAPPKETILVFGKWCKMPHVAFYDYGDWLHVEACYDNGGHFSGGHIEFDYWKPLPEPPKDSL